jgi:K+-sensing histidine kinase KdpD
MLAIIPIILASAFFGFRKALIVAAVGGIFFFLSPRFPEHNRLPGQVFGNWPAFAVTIIVSGVIGRLHDLHAAREQELVYRRGVESRLYTLNQINQSIVRGGSPEAIGQSVVGQIGDVLACDCVTLLVYDVESATSVRVLAAYNRTYGLFEISNVYQPELDAVLACPLHGGDVNACNANCRLDLRSYLSVPLVARDKKVGALNVAALLPDHFNAERRSIIHELAAQLAIALDNAQLHSDQKRYVTELEALRMASLHLTERLDREHVLGSIIEHALRLTGADNAHIFLYDGETLSFGAAHWGGKLQDRPLQEPRPTGLTMMVIRLKQRVVVSDGQAHALYEGAPFHFDGSIIGMPLLMSEGVVGVMSVAYDIPHSFTPHELRMLELFADHAAIAIFNIGLVERIQQQNEVLEQRVAERTAALLDVNRSMEAILDNSSDAILLLSAASGRVERVNKTAVAWFGESLMATEWTWEPYVAPESQPLLRRYYHQVVETGEPSRLELVMRTQTQSHVYVDMALTLDRSEGRSSRVVCSLRDISVRIRAEQTNARWVAGLRAMVDAAYALLSCSTLDELSREAVLTACSGLGLERCALFLPHDENFYGTYGTDRDGALVDEHKNHFSIVDPIWAERLAKLKIADAKWIVVDQELLDWRDDRWQEIGVYSWVAITPLRTPQGMVGILFNDSGKTGKALDPVQQELVYLYASLLANILARKQLEEDLRYALRKERELNELKTRFVSMVSHEFRTPLAIIQSSGDMLKYYNERMTSDLRKEKLEVIHEQIRHLTGLLEDILAISRADSVGLELNRVALDVTSLCAAIVSEFEGTTHNRKINLKIVGLPRRVLLDPKLIRQAFSNLLSNAIKYSAEETPIDVSLSFSQTQVTLTVTDYGIGIPLSEQERVFEVFHRATNVEHISGTGLGLAIVKHVADLHEGQIFCESEPGKGTTFRLRLPIIEDAASVRVRRPASTA